MASRHDSRSWESFLPPIYTWLEKTTIALKDAPPEKSCLVLGVKYNDGFSIFSNAVNDKLKEEILALATTAGWKGKGPELVMCANHPVLLVPVSSLEVGKVRLGRDVGLAAAKHLNSRTVMPLSFIGTDEVSALDVFEGYCQGGFSIGLFKGDADKKEFPANVTLVDKSVTAQLLAESKSYSRSILFARMLQDAPANWLTPEKWAAIAKDYFSNKSVELTVLGRNELVAQNMGSFLSVAAGSPLEPKLISIKIAGKNPGKSVALIGKGLTFDAGGISLKPSLGMGEMKYDMSGGSAVMGAAHFLADNQPAVNVHCVIGVVENMPSGSATRPGDIVQSRSGKTIEVLNTDAEGRMVLADLLSYAADNKPNLMIDLATLTGAVLQGLGSVGAAVLSNRNEIAQHVFNVGNKVGEPYWQLPLWPELQEEVKSEVADLKNIAKANVNAGTIIGGTFLKEFVPDTIPWAHLDIAGTGWTCAATGFPKTGGSGFGIRTISEICKNFDLT